jgi:hypothetical protein
VLSGLCVDRRDRLVIAFEFSCFRGVLLSGNILEELGDRLSGDGIHHVRGNLDQRLEYEAPLAKTRVRHDQAGFVDGGITIQQEIEIEAARSVRIGTLAAPLVFDGQQGLEQFARRHRRLPYRRGIPEERLGTGRTHGNGVAEPRYAKASKDVPETGDCVVEVIGPIAEIAAETNRCN